MLLFLLVRLRVKISLLSSVDDRFGDDFSTCELSTVRADVLTDQPHRYYYNIESVEEYLEETEESTDPPYEISFRLDIGEDGIDREYIPENIRSNAESLMSSRMSDLISTKGVTTYEAESIVFDGTESTTLFVWQDIEE